MVIKTMSRKRKLSEENNEDHEELSKEVLVIAQEIKIVKSLACNDLVKRNRQLKRLRKWLELRTSSSFPFKEEDFRRMWKGLYYTMWMSDKPLVQEDLAEQLGKLLLCFKGDLQASTDFFGAFLYTMCVQWFGIDQWRIDKFMMLVRRMLRYMFRVLKDAGWPIDGIKFFNKHLTETVLAEKVSAAGLTLHFLDVFCDELAKVANGKISAKQVGNFIKPFVVFYCTQRDFKLTSHCRTRIFYHLLYQSTLGREYNEKYNAWKEMGFPTASINDLEKTENENADGEQQDDGENKQAEMEQQHLDPRAGNVDVFMPELPLDVKYIIDSLEPYIHTDDINTKRRKLFRKLLDICKTYQNGEFPLGIKRMPHLDLQPKEEVIADKIDTLEEVEDELYGVGRTLKQLNKRKRRKLLKALNLDDADEDNFDTVVKQALPKDILKEKKRKALDQLMNGWVEEEVDADLVPKKKQKTTTKEEDVNEKSSKKDSKILQKKSKINQSKQIHENTLNGKQENEKKHVKVSEAIEMDSSKLQSTPKTASKKTVNTSEWNKPLEEGEVEYFIPSRKIQLKKANSELVLNPLAMKKKMSAIAMMTSTSVSANNSPKTPTAIKRVKIALKHNTAQNPSEYIRQVKCSPDVPYDATKKPGKGLLKPNCVPSPINPFYKKKIGLRLLNDTM